ncbi:hypothetical protein L2E82_47912 [Cichorium intybus]|uniref:Uncharacterized protein n=1 Tax=Cichorium intybus TaxID=13427 RepID=A0ACB8YXJ4_CICIN|nr:hypothetical protein L2E82_47912 [Cichorium intybus]
MGNENRTSVGGGGAPVTQLEFDVGLGLNSEPAYPCKKTSFINQNRHHHQGSEICSDFARFYGNNGGQLFVNPSNTNNQFASGVSFKSNPDRVNGASGKLLFTANQWQELERQTTIYKYIIASIPIPPHLLLPSSTQPINRTGTGIRFSNGSDPEPWRCRRTDGKKWRCAKDVGPNQKYCERHAHKTRSRSRKPVDNHHINSITNTNNTPSSNQQPRCTEWFMKNGAIPISQSNNQLKRDDCSLSLSMQSSNGVEFGDQDSFQMAFGMLEGDRGGFGDQATWVGSSSTPGGPLGEALCLGINTNNNIIINGSNMGQNVGSCYGYSNSTSTSGSCEGGDGRGWFN